MVNMHVFSQGKSRKSLVLLKYNYSPYLDVWPAETLARGDVTLIVVGAPGVTVTSLAAIRVRLRQPVMLRQTLNTKV